MTAIRESRAEAVRLLRQVASRRDSDAYGLRLGAKASRHLAWIESEGDWGPRWRDAIEARAAEIAQAEKQSVLYNYHVCQAVIELFNEDPRFRATMRAQVDHVMPRSPRGRAS